MSWWVAYCLLVLFLAQRANFDSHSSALAVYEFCANGALEDRLRRPTTERPAYSWSQRLTLAVESARALVYLHTLPKPIVHRDIKSSNVLVSDEYHAKLCDFGTGELVRDTPTLLSLPHSLQFAR